MSHLTLEEVNMDNLFKVCKLSDTLSPGQQRCVAPNVYSIAQAHFYEHAWFRAVYLDGVPIGFVMVDIQPSDLPPEEAPSVFLWRFMIARDFQHKGYGRQVLDIITDKYRKEGKKYLYVSCEMDEEEGPYQFYLNYGFKDTGVMEDDEEVLKMKL